LLFNSLPFTLFLPLVFILYWLIGASRIRLQNVLLIVASYIFYGWWDYRFLSLIFISSMVDYILGLSLGKTKNQTGRKVLLTTSLLVNLGLLGFFKYFNFFVDSFENVVESMGMQVNPVTLSIILPVGISFYTFQTLSYTIDIYRREIEPTKDILSFFAFVSFFPQLVAGPIERAKNLLPQFIKERSFDNIKAKDGLRQMLWGFFKKIVIADNLAPHVTTIFENSDKLDGLTLFLGVFFFAIQIYCDFSGYSDIAIGTARLFGFNLMRNFNFPYFSRDIAEFWRRWHISLSSWFRDYLYIPIGGSYVGQVRRIWNIVVIFTVSGFWHGANWTFIIWGLLNGLYYIPLMLRNKQKRYTDHAAEDSFFPGFGESLAMLKTFLLALLAWVFFRADSVGHALSYIWRTFSVPFLKLDYSDYLVPLVYGVGVLLIEWPSRKKQFGLSIENFPIYLRWPIYIVVIAAIIVLGNFGKQEFIYFQF